MSKRVLVFPCGSEIGLEINRALAYCKDIELYGASSNVSNHGQYVYKNFIDDVPYVTDPIFIKHLNGIIEKYKIDYIFPAHDSVVYTLAQKREELLAEIISSPIDTCLLCRSKKRTYEYFKDIIDVPILYENSDQPHIFPVFLKPDIGQGSKGVFKAFSKEEIGFYLRLDKSLLIMEYLPGKEYTIDCFTDKEGRLIFVGSRERARTSNGISVCTFPVKNEKFVNLANLINKNLKMRGAWFFQVKEREEQQYVLMEIAPRIAGSMGMYRSLGINLPLMSFYDFEGYQIKVSKNNFDVVMDRALINRYKLNISYEHVYIDLDDTLVVKNKVNTIAVQLIYQCINNGIKVHLMTKHRGNLMEYLDKYRLNGLFDSIIHLKDNEEKINYIRERAAVFIDDSFSERKKVEDSLNICTFDVNSIDSLIDWRV